MNTQDTFITNSRRIIYVRTSKSPHYIVQCQRSVDFHIFISTFFHPFYLSKKMSDWIHHGSCILEHDYVAIWHIRCK